MTYSFPLDYPTTQTVDRTYRVNLIALFLCMLVSFAGCQRSTSSASPQQSTNKQKVSDKMNNFNFRHDDWQTTTVNLHRADGTTLKVQAQKTIFRYGAEGDFDHPMEVVAFKMPASNKSWIGIMGNFYFEVDSNIVGCQLSPEKETLYWRETLYDNTTPAPSLNAAIASFESNIDVTTLASAAVFDDVPYTSIEDKITNERFFFAGSTGGDMQLSSFAIENQVLRLDIRNNTTSNDASAWIDIPSRQITKVTENGEQTFSLSSEANRLRLGWPSRIVFVTIMLVVIILIVPGIQIPKFHTKPGTIDLPSSNVFFSHGWPLEYMRSPTNTNRFDHSKIEWLWSNAWPVNGDLYDFRLTNLLTDILCGCLMIFIATWLTNRWWGRAEKGKRAWHSFTIKNLLTAAALIGFSAVCFSWYSSHAKDKAIEDASDYGFRWTGSMSPADPQIEYSYHGPMWLRRLASSEILSVFYHRTKIKHIGDVMLPLTKENSQEIVKLKYAESISSDCNFRYLHGLLKSLKRLPKLNSLSLKMTNFHPVIKDGEVIYLAGKHPRITTINDRVGTVEHCYGPVLDSTEIEVLSGFSKLRRLSLTDAHLSAASLTKLSQLPRLEYLEFTGEEIFIEDLQCLNQFKSLKEVKLTISATGKELQEFQAKHSQLQIHVTRAVSDSRVLAARFRRATDGALGIAENYISSGSLNLEKVALKSQHLVFLEDPVLEQFLGQVESLDLGEVDSCKTAIEIINRCPALYNLGIQQRELTLAELRQLIARKPECLTIVESTMTRDDALSLLKIAPDCQLTVWGIASAGEELPLIYDW